jgi:hypothetical protein
VGRELSITLSFGGTATFETDYLPQGRATAASEATTVVFPEGEKHAELYIDILDDVPAEEDETLTLSLEDGPGYRLGWRARRARMTIPQNDFAVTHTGDRGAGSLRQAILNANALGGAPTITFDSEVGSFATPQTISLERPLPLLTGHLEIDGRIPDRLWQPRGVTISGLGEQRVFEVAPGGHVKISALTIADGHA